MPEWLDVSFEMHYTNTKELSEMIIGIKITNAMMRLVITGFLDISAEFYTKSSKSYGVIRPQVDILQRQK